MNSANWWLGLGYFDEAISELNQIDSRLSGHPDVFSVRWKLYSASEKWELAAETARAIRERTPHCELGWLILAHALHKLGRTEEARSTLLSAVQKFPDDPMIHYDLARFACHMGDLSEAWEWLDRMLAEVGTEEAILLAVQDPDLSPLLGRRKHTVKMVRIHLGRESLIIIHVTETTMRMAEAAPKRMTISRRRRS